MLSSYLTINVLLLSLTGCNTAACIWDGQDCSDEKQQYSVGDLVIIVAVTPEQFVNMTKVFLRDLGSLLRAVVMVKKDANGQDMVYPYYEGQGTSVGRRKRMLPTG